MEDTKMTFVAEDQTKEQEFTNSPQQGIFLQKSCKSSIDIDGEYVVCMKYTLEQTPAWYITFLLGFQHYVTMLGGSITLPLLLAPCLCIKNDEVAKTQVLNTMVFVTGLATFLQTSVGTRLPIVQGATFAMIAPAFVILSREEWKCPNYTLYRESAIANGSSGHELSPYKTTEHREMWNSRMREIQGAIIVASLSQVFIGGTGIMGTLLRFIGPLTVAPTLSLIGLSFFSDLADFCASHWGITFLSFVLMTIFSQYLRDIPICTYSKQAGWHCIRYPIFVMFPVMITIVVCWGFCAVLTVCGVFSDDPMSETYAARSDAKIKALSDAEWFRIPYPGQWGCPSVSIYGVCGMIAGVIAGIIESVGDYYACAKLVGAPTPPLHAVNRGVFVEGITCILAGFWGSGAGTTSYTENISVMAVTKVGSRRVVLSSGIVMMVMATFGKFGAVFVSIPDPVIGGVSIVLFGLIGSIGMSNLQHVDMQSSRNLFVVGMSFFLGLMFPSWLKANPGAIHTGIEELDQIIMVVCGSSMFVGGIIGFFLDNTLPGTDKERGIDVWRKHPVNHDQSLDQLKADVSSAYDLPFGMAWIKRNKWTRYLPISPTFTGFRFEACRGRRG